MLAWLATGTLVGLMLGKYLTISYGTALLLIGLILLLGALRSCRWWTLGAIVIAGMLFGGCLAVQRRFKYNFRELESRLEI